MPLRFVSLCGFGLLVIGVIALFMNHSLLADGYFSIGVQVIAVFLMLWARMTFGTRSFHAAANPTEGGLVTSGPYRLIRHPIYAAILYFMVAGAISHISILNIGLTIIAIVGVAMRVHAEEVLLVQRYPEYREYVARTKRFVPFIL
jgi:protein-S-isoprenylcysteine O-methyltransferase Ste14